MSSQLWKTKKAVKNSSIPELYVRGNVDSAQLSKEIAAYSSLSPGDVKNTLDNLVTVMGQHADDIRYHKTVKAVKKALFHKGLMYRYNNEDDFGLPSSAFTICTFWLIRALYVIGEKEEARCLFNEVLSYSNHLGLFSEDINFDTKEQLGNFPQAYSHLALVNTAILFAEEEKRLDFIRP